VTGHQPAGLAPLDQVQNQIQEAIGYKKMEPALRSYLSQLRDQAYIEIRPGYMDSGSTGHEQKFLMGAYTPPQPKHRKHAERARFRQKPVRKEKQTESASGGVPAGVPTLDKVNNQKGAPKAVASSKTQKPGKREKIRFGQAPRETLPAGDTREVDAGAGTDTTATQVAANQPGNSVVTNAEGNVIDNGNESDKKVKTRFSDRPKETQQKREKEKEAKANRFAPPKETAAEVAQEKQQQSALGLNGDTTKVKKANPAKSGPKRRLSDEDKSQDKSTDQQPQGATTPQSGTTPPPPGPGSPQ
jgi:peptidyl-prolyl cis-trans isomerase SurA